MGLKTLRRLARRRSARTEAGAFVVEGGLSIAAALDSGIELIEVFAEPAADPDLLEVLERAGVEVTHLDTGRLEGIVSTRSPQPVAALAATPSMALADLDPTHADLVVVLVDVGDPGNVGTLLRVAEATGVAAVLCVGESADPFSPKSVRASAGSVFSVGVMVDKEAFDTVHTLSTRGWSVLATSSHADVAYDRTDLTGPTAIVLGSESNGLPPELASVAEQTVQIPMVGNVESLNVAMAGAVLCFESLRQRRLGTS